VAEVAGHSDAGLQAAHDSGLLPALTAELNNSDILLQMNALELVTKLALFENGLQYLQQHGIVTALANKVTAINEDPLASLTLPGDLYSLCVSCSLGMFAE
jgi:26S proteasome non-ATPase regulatory subunit 5